jgi:predicted O-methyltransferase YrrM
VSAFAEVPTPPVDAYQSPIEFGRLWDLVASRPHARILEVGSLFGGTLWWWSHLPRLEELVSVDVPTDWAPLADQVREARAQWEGWFSPRCTFTLIDGDSHDQATIDRVEGPFDFAFIDGDHSYDGVRADWLAYSPKIRPGGMVAFHDTWPNEDRVEPGVVRWVDELRHHRPSIEWTSPDGVGICAFELPGGAEG